MSLRTGRIERRVAHRVEKSLFQGAQLLLFVLLACQQHAKTPAGRIAFLSADGKRRTLSLSELAQHCSPRTVVTYDPYYDSQKRFQAMPIASLLSFAFRLPESALRQQTFMLVARDGYSVPLSGEQLFGDKAFVAIDDLDVPGFAPIGPQRVSPAPAYLIWEGSQKQNLVTHPRPWQLDTIKIIDVATLYPHTVPKGAGKGSAAMRGYNVFRGHCIRCHAINREGGHVGPDLNVPQSITAYRPEAQIRAYIQNPLTFRYGNMPANPDLTLQDLDALLAYLHTMARQPYDPGAKAP